MVKSRDDTAWHHVRNMEFTNQFGKKVSFADLKGKIIVLDFFLPDAPHLPATCKSNEAIAKFIYS